MNAEATSKQSSTPPSCGCWHIMSTITRGTATTFCPRTPGMEGRQGGVRVRLGCEVPRRRTRQRIVMQITLLAARTTDSRKMWNPA